MQADPEEMSLEQLAAQALDALAEFDSSDSDTGSESGENPEGVGSTSEPAFQDLET